MPATPAWPPQSTPRLFVEAPLHAGAAIPLDGAPAHYLLSVMRLKEGDPVKLFDGMSGEWLGIARAVRKRDLVRSEEHTSELQSLMRISYAVFCLKKKKKST